MAAASVDMGQDELVLRISADDTQLTVRSTANQGAPLTTSSTTTSSHNNNNIQYRGSKGSKSKNLTHSRESSGASVKFINGEHRRTQSKGSDQSCEIILHSPSVEDLTLSDRLSNEEDFNDDLNDEEDCANQRLLADEEMNAKESLLNRPVDESSDYGSFYNASSKNKGKSSTPKKGKQQQSKLMDPDGKGEEKKGDENPDSNDPGKNAPDNSVMANESHQRQPLIAPSPDTTSSDDEYGANSSGYTRRKSRHPREHHHTSRIETDHADCANEPEEETPIPNEYMKTFLSFLFITLAWVATTTSLALTHERVPDIEPLPDVFLDNVYYQSWGLSASEIIIMVSTIFAALVALFHKHRSVIFRRIFFLGGLHYFYRAITMFITVLPKADPYYKCEPKMHNLTFVSVTERVVKLLSGMGLSINGQHVYCGDYIYSGHTMTLVMTYLVIKEYSPRRWFPLHWFSFISVVGGIITLLCSRGHYSVDVLIAYWITTRLWWIYHTLANNRQFCSKENKHNYLTRFWWWHIFNYFECNVGRPLPKKFTWPLPEMVLAKMRTIPHVGRYFGEISGEGTRNNRRERDAELGQADDA